jgi:hypothetical protein
MSYSKTRHGAPRPNFAENHPYEGGTSKYDDVHNGHTSEGNYEADGGGRETVFPDAPSMGLSGCSSQGYEKDLRHNDKTFCQFDKTLLQEKFGAEAFRILDDLTDKMSGFLNNHDKLTGKSGELEKDTSLIGQNVSFEGDLCIDSSHLSSGFPSASSHNGAATDEAFSFPSTDGANKSSFDRTVHKSPTFRSPLTPQSFQEAEKLAKLLCKTKLVPPGFESPDLCLIAILQGMEMGLPPLTALQRMALVEGKLTLWGDGALALVLKSGLCTSITEWMGLGDQDEFNKESSNNSGVKDMTFDPLMQKREDEWVAFCEVTRAHWLKPIRRSFSVIEAKRAGLWKKEGPWLDYPKRMLQMRARAFALRDAFADVLGGLYVREEIELKAAYTQLFKQSAPTSQSDQRPTTQQRNRRQSAHPEIHHKSEKPDQIKQAQHDVGQKLASDGETQYHDSHAASPSTQPIDPKLSHISKHYLIWGAPVTSNPERIKAPPPSIQSTRGLVQPKQQNEQENENTVAINTNQSDKLEKNEANEEKQEPSAHAKRILSEFKAALHECQTSEDLDACRLKFQPALDTLTPDGLDQAAQIYLEQEAWIEGGQKSLKSPPAQNRPRQHPQIRRWKAQYRPFQGKKGSKKLHNNNWNPAINHEGPD